MIVTMITQEQISTLSLPSKVSGRYWVSVKSKDREIVDATDIEGIQNQWFIHSNATFLWLDENGQDAKSLALRDGHQVINGQQRKTGAKVQLYVEPSTKDRQLYKKYCIQGACRLSIGRTSDNQIIFDNKYVSSHHAILLWQNGQWNITDTQSSNGTFVNDQRIVTKQLVPGDVVYIMGLRIVVGDGFFALNDPDNAITISTSVVVELAQQPLCENDEYADRFRPELYQSSPRISRCIEKECITVDPPSPVQKPDETPLALLLGPALTMGLTAVVMAAVAAINLMNGTSTLLTALPTIIMSFSMLCGTLLWPLLTKRSEKRKAIRAEKVRQDRYREYLDRIRDEIYKLSEEQKSILLENFPSIDECESRIENREHSLWERTAGQRDFLSIRLGSGEVPLQAEIKYPEARFSTEVDLLQNEVARMKAEPRQLSNAPITCSLTEHPLLGIVGADHDIKDFLQTMVLQIAALHSYQDVQLVFFIEEPDEGMWNAYRLLPHVQSNDGELRYYAVGVDEAKTVALHLEHIWSERKERHVSTAEHESTYYVLISESSSIPEQIPLFAKIGNQKEDIGFCAITIAEKLAELPKECSAVVELGRNQGTLYEQGMSSSNAVSFCPEFSELRNVRILCEVMGNLVMHTQDNKSELPNMLTFLEMYHVGNVEHLNAPMRWEENSPVNSLQVPIGVGENGTVLNLDLHEKAHGPHGLIAGMTGSGKSEFVITYILSMAVNYHPNEVSFILIDYKGGGLAGAFEDPVAGIKLPHLAGTITNLDGSEVNRALISIQSELRRRQTIFNRAKQAVGDGTMDIYKYQKLFRSGVVTEPVSHLFIVSDEFAELKAQQPEFMAQLISAARIGRSLGVHLILATQKPTGVVDDQIWSNSRFRVCLKVQERADSAEMLKRPDAAELKDTGRFYLQVGFNELFELGQSAWCGAPYVPSDSVETKQDDSVAVIDHLGRILLDVKPSVGAKVAQASQVVSIVKYLSTLAAGENISARELWLPSIPALIYLDDLRAKYPQTTDEYDLQPIIGEFDDPFNQSQGLLTIPFSSMGNALIYGVAGSGKTTMLNTMLVDLLLRYDATQLNIYLVDLGEETLRVFKDAPQIGEVLFSSDGEKIGGLFKMLQDEIANRKKLFAIGDGSYISYCKTTGDVIPQILVIIRNYAAFAEQFDALDDRLIQITRECNKYGIYFLMTANAANTVRYRVAQNFSITYALQLNDTSDYVGIFGGTGGVYPSKIKGRGIFKSDKVYEFQTAHFARDASQQALRGLVEQLNVGTDGVIARRIPTLPDRVVPSFFDHAPTLSSIPIGVEKATLRSCHWDLSRTVVTLVLSQDAEELGMIVRGISEQLEKLDGTLTIMDGLGILNESPDMAYLYLHSNFAGRIEELFREMVHRNNTYKQATAEAQECEPYSSEYFVITGFQSIYESLNEQCRDELNTLIEKAELHYNIRFILCDNPKSLSAYSSQSWYKRHVTGMDGIWVGDGIADQYLLKIGKLSNELYSEIPPCFGYVVKRGKPVLTKLIVGESNKEDTDQWANY